MLPKVSPAFASLLVIAGCPAPPAQAPTPPPPPPPLHDHWEALTAVEQLAALRPAGARGVSSYDREGGNDDGFEGTWSALRVEDGNSVIAEMDGPGVVERIWTTHAQLAADGLLATGEELVRFHVDGDPTPTLELPWIGLFDGSDPRFPAPLAGSGIGGFFSYVPIPFSDSMKVVVEGTDTRFYQVGWRSLPDRPVTSWSAALATADAGRRAEAVELWTLLGDPDALDIADRSDETMALDLQVGEAISFVLPAGPRALRALRLTSSSLEGRLRIWWDEALEPAVDAPLALLFGQAWELTDYRSLLVGRVEGTSYLYLPSPYRSGARLEIEAENAALSGELVVTVGAWTETEEHGYLHAVAASQSPTPPGQPFVPLAVEGSGHFAGLILASTGPAGPPRWLEGDDRFFVDGDLVVHGTGTEDYFNAGWYGVPGRLEGPGVQALHGFPVYREVEGRIQTTAFRMHLADPVGFSTSFVLELEHGPAGEVEADYSSVAFWYSPLP